MNDFIKKLSIFINILITINCVKSLIPDKSIRNWESICAVLLCKPVLDKCVQNECIGLTQCRNCVQNENPTCLRCVDTIMNEQYFTVNGTQTIICDQVNNLHETTCSFYCRTKEINDWRCEQIGGYPLCY